jgi:hypothetical protein
MASLIAPDARRSLLHRVLRKPNQRREYLSTLVPWWQYVLVVQI